MIPEPVAVVALAGLATSATRFIRVRSDRGRVSVAMSGWLALWVATGSTWAARAREQLPAHMVSHIVVMFLAPIALTWAGASRHWWWMLPVSRRRALLGWWYRGRRWHLVRALGHPILAGLALNVVMVVSHLPKVFNFVMAHDAAMAWGMEPAFLLSGALFFHHLVPSGRRRLRGALRWQLALVSVTMLEMLVMAMAMAIFTSTAWYAMPMPGMNMTVAMPFHDQQLAAAILWICGDFWAVPCLVAIVRRVIVRDGSLFAALESQSSRWSASF